MTRFVRWILGATSLLSLWSIPAWAVNPGPPTVTSLFVPLLGDVALTNGDVVSFSGEVHVLAQARFSDTGVLSVSIYVNLTRVQGMGASGTDYVLVGATSTQWVGVSPGPPGIPEQTFNFSLVSLAVPPSPVLPPSPILPVFLRNFSFCQESNCAPGALQSVQASFVSD
jgi:hypothetical protein